MNQKKAKKNSFNRKSNKPKYSGDNILIICEDAVTSPSYFRDIIKKLKIQSARVDICGEECGSAPISVVNFALARKKKGNKGLKYDQVWCVIDYDKHVDLYPAIDKANSNKLKVALSRPCFEFWYLLHKHYSAKPYENYDDLENDLKDKIKGYDKNNICFDELFPKIEKAKQNAEKIREHHESSRQHNSNPIDDNPSTKVDKLIDQLQNIKMIK